VGETHAQSGYRRRWRQSRLTVFDTERESGVMEELEMTESVLSIKRE